MKEKEKEKEKEEGKTRLEEKGKARSNVRKKRDLQSKTLASCFSKSEIGVIPVVFVEVITIGLW